VEFGLCASVVNSDVCRRWRFLHIQQWNLLALERQSA
jgi:hypothetical protein